jgi:hypothetical protein
MKRKYCTLGLYFITSHILSCKTMSLFGVPSHSSLCPRHSNCYIGSLHDSPRSKRKISRESITGVHSVHAVSVSSGSQPNIFCDLIHEQKKLPFGFQRVFRHCQNDMNESINYQITQIAKLYLLVYRWFWIVAPYLDCVSTFPRTKLPPSSGLKWGVMLNVFLYGRVLSSQTNISSSEETYSEKTHLNSFLHMITPIN